MVTKTSITQHIIKGIILKHAKKLFDNLKFLIDFFRFCGKPLVHDLISSLWKFCKLKYNINVSVSIY